MTSHRGPGQPRAAAAAAAEDAGGQREPARARRLTYIIDTVDTDRAGTENQLLKMIRELGAAGYEVSLLCLRDDPWLHNNRHRIACDFLVIPMHRFRRPEAYLNFLRLAAHLRRSAPDIVHTFFPVGNIVGVLAARLAGVPAVVSSRRDQGEWMTGGYLLATRFANRWTDRVVANSTAVAELCVSKERLPSHRVQVILNGIDVSVFTGRERESRLRGEMGIPPAHRVVGIVANFFPVKHHETLLLATREMLKTAGDITVVMIGCGPRLEEMRELAARLGVAGNVRFTGARGDVDAFLSLMDVGVNCSEREGLSNAVMEYMAAGLPSVVTAVGGNPDLIEDGGEGYLFAQGDWKRLAELLSYLLEKPELREEMGRRARRKVEREMSLKRMMTRYDELYQSLLEAPE